MNSFKQAALVASVAAALTLTALHAQAQAVQSAPAPQAAPTATPVTPPAPPSWQQGRPDLLKGSTLAPNPPGLTAKAASDIKLDKIKLPPGFRIELWADGMPNARSIAVGDKGTVFVGTRLVEAVYAVTEQDGKRTTKPILKGLHRPNGIVFHKGDLYVAELSRILKFRDIENNLDNPGKPEIVFDALPKDEPHGWKYMVMGPDNKLYFNIGAPCNICVPPDTHAQITRVDLVKGVRETVVKGVRNSVGITFHPVTKELWFTNHGRDWMGEDMPNDTLHRASLNKHAHMGYPYCHQGDTLDPDHGKGRSCDEFTPPVLKLGTHIAPLGLRFYTGNMFPAQYRNRIFIANHGSWNKANKIGFNIMQVTLDANGKATKYEPFAEGWADGNNYWGRPVDIQVMKDGALLVSDDETGALYRISYKKP